MSDYETMQDRIATELTRSDLTTEVQSAIQSAILHYEAEPFWFTERTFTRSTVADQQNYTLSGSTVAILSLKIDVNNTEYQLNPRDYAWFEAVDTSSSFSGYPYDYAIFADQVFLYPQPNDAYTMTFSDIGKLSTLSDDTDTNAWMTDGEVLIRQRAKAIVKIDVLHEPGAIQEASNFSNRGLPFLSGLERSAYNALKGKTFARSSGPMRMRATAF